MVLCIVLGKEDGVSGARQWEALRSVWWHRSPGGRSREEEGAGRNVGKLWLL